MSEKLIQSYVRHNAIVVTSWKREAIKAAATEAMRLGLQVVGPGDEVINGYSSLLIAPDGSKEGWHDSDCGDAKREQFRAWMKSLRYSDDSSPLEWCEVAYGSDDREAEICHSEWKTLDQITPDS
jgi:hypothetical protein